MAFDTIGNNLIVADAYYGIWSVDLKNGRKTLLVSPKEELEGKVILMSYVFFFIKDQKFYQRMEISYYLIEFGIFFISKNRFAVRQKYLIRLLYRNQVIYFGRILHQIFILKMAFTRSLLIHRAVYSTTIVQLSKIKCLLMNCTLPMVLL